MIFPEGSDAFIKLELNHFSPYAVYDYLTAAEKDLQNSGSQYDDTEKQPGDDAEKQEEDRPERLPGDENQKYIDRNASEQAHQSSTGDQRDMLPWVMLASMAIMLAAGAVITRKGQV